MERESHLQRTIRTSNWRFARNTIHSSGLANLAVYMCVFSLVFFLFLDTHTLMGTSILSKISHIAYKVFWSNHIHVITFLFFTVQFRFV